MTNGVAAMFERIAEEERQLKLHKLTNTDQKQVLSAIEQTINALEEVKRTQPSLTEYQWSLINNSLQELQDLI